jgi:hypothetical protein
MLLSLLFSDTLCREKERVPLVPKENHVETIEGIPDKVGKNKLENLEVDDRKFP